MYGLLAGKGFKPDSPRWSILAFVGLGNYLERFAFHLYLYVDVDLLIHSDIYLGR